MSRPAAGGSSPSAAQSLQAARQSASNPSLATSAAQAVANALRPPLQHASMASVATSQSPGRPLSAALDLNSARALSGGAARPSSTGAGATAGGARSSGGSASPPADAHNPFGGGGGAGAPPALSSSGPRGGSTAAALTQSPLSPPDPRAAATGGGRAQPAPGSSGGHHHAGPYEVPHYVPPWLPENDVLNSEELETGGVPVRGAVPMFRDIEAFLRSPLGPRVMGSLSASTYAVTFTPNGPLPSALRHLPRSFFSIPVAAIRKVERTGISGGKSAGGSGNVAYLMEIVGKDCRTLQLGFRDEPTADKMAGHIRMVAFPSKVEFLHAFSEPPPSTEAAAAVAAAAASAPALMPFPGWDAFSPYRELDRLGVLGVTHPITGEPLWRVSDLNREYEFAPTYPSVLVFPERAGDAHMSIVATFRSKARVPALTWMHPLHKCTLWRCSQPRVGMGNNTCAQDEAMLAMIRECNVHSRDPSQPLLIIDCRPRANAMANKAGGWGYESYVGCTLEFCGMNNIHALRDSYRKLETLCLHATPSDVNWAAGIAESGWVYHVRTMLSASLFTAEAMHRRGQSVVVHCSDGWDRTAQVCGIVQLLLDPFFRTLRGLCTLIGKEWCSFGHKFHDRAGHAMEKHDDSDISPVFIQFLDGVYQLVRQFPGAFEFTPRALLLIAHHLHSCRFGTFLYNSERERAANGLTFKTPSLWAYLLAHSQTLGLVNPLYDPGAGDVLLPHPASCLRGVMVWEDWFLRYSPFPSLAPCCGRLERYPPAAYDHARVRAAAVVVSPAARAAAAATAAAAVAAAAAAAAQSTAATATTPTAAAVGAAPTPASAPSTTAALAASPTAGQPAAAPGAAPQGAVDPLAGASAVTTPFLGHPLATSSSSSAGVAAAAPMPAPVLEPVSTAAPAVAVAPPAAAAPPPPAATAEDGGAGLTAELGAMAREADVAFPAAALPSAAASVADAPPVLEEEEAGEEVDDDDGAAGDGPRPSFLPDADAPGDDADTDTEA